MCPLAECKIKKKYIINKKESQPMKDPKFTDISQNTWYLNYINTNIDINIIID